MSPWPSQYITQAQTQCYYYSLHYRLQLQSVHCYALCLTPLWDYNVSHRPSSWSGFCSPHCAWRTPVWHSLCHRVPPCVPESHFCDAQLASMCLSALVHIPHWCAGGEPVWCPLPSHTSADLPWSWTSASLDCSSGCQSKSWGPPTRWSGRDWVTDWNPKLCFLKVFVFYWVNGSQLLNALLPLPPHSKIPDSKLPNTFQFSAAFNLQVQVYY